MPFPGVEQCNAFERSFDFSDFPNLQEVSFGTRVSWSVGGLPWIHLALSTLRPATSPRLSAVQLKFSRSACIYIIGAQGLIKNVGNDLRQIADEVARIEREFEGVVNFTVLRDSGFGAALDRLNVSFCLRLRRGFAAKLIHLHLFLPDPSGPRPVELTVSTHHRGAVHLALFVPRNPQLNHYYLAEYARRAS